MMVSDLRVGVDPLHRRAFGPRATVIDEYRGHSSNSAWVEQMQKVSYTTSVSAHDPVITRRPSEP
jgi:hypothetical protein